MQAQMQSQQKWDFRAPNSGKDPESRQNTPIIAFNNPIKREFLDNLTL